MSYMEIKAIKLVAALHRGLVNTAVRTLGWRTTRAVSKHDNSLVKADRMEDFAMRLGMKANSMRNAAEGKLAEDYRNITAATHTVLNLRDDLAKIA